MAETVNGPSGTCQWSLGVFVWTSKHFRTEVPQVVFTGILHRPKVSPWRKKSACHTLPMTSRDMIGCEAPGLRRQWSPHWLDDEKFKSQDKNTHDRKSFRGNYTASYEKGTVRTVFSWAWERWAHGKELIRRGKRAVSAISDMIQLSGVKG